MAHIIKAKLENQIGPPSTRFVHPLSIPIKQLSGPSASDVRD